MGVDFSTAPVSYLGFDPLEAALASTIAYKIVNMTR
jgi:hypothetical protein